MQAYLRAYLDSRNGPLLPGEAAPVIRIVRALDYLERRRARSEGLAVLPARERGRERGS